MGRKQVSLGLRQLVQTLSSVWGQSCNEIELKATYLTNYGVPLDEKEIEKFFGVKTLESAAKFFKNYISITSVPVVQEVETEVLALKRISPKPTETKQDFEAETLKLNDGEARVLAAFDSWPAEDVTLVELADAYHKIHCTAFDEKELEKLFGVNSIHQFLASDVLKDVLEVTIATRKIEEEMRVLKFQLIGEVPLDDYFDSEYDISSYDALPKKSEINLTYKGPAIVSSLTTEETKKQKEAFTNLSPYAWSLYNRLTQAQTKRAIAEIVEVLVRFGGEASLLSVKTSLMKSTMSSKLLFATEARFLHLFGLFGSEIEILDAPDSFKSRLRLLAGAKVKTNKTRSLASQEMINRIVGIVKTCGGRGSNDVTILMFKMTYQNKYKTNFEDDAKKSFPDVNVDNLGDLAEEIKEFVSLTKPNITWVFKLPQNKNTAPKNQKRKNKRR